MKLAFTTAFMKPRTKGSYPQHSICYTLYREIPPARQIKRNINWPAYAYMHAKGIGNRRAFFEFQIARKFVFRSQREKYHECYYEFSLYTIPRYSLSVFFSIFITMIIIIYARLKKTRQNIRYSGITGKSRSAADASSLMPLVMLYRRRKKKSRQKLAIINSNGPGKISNDRPS